MDDRLARRLLGAAAVLSLASATLHLVAMPEHYAEWWGYGAFFLVTAMAQGVLAVGLEALRRYGGRAGEALPAPLSAGPRRLYAFAILGNLALVGLYVLTRTVGVPLLGPGAGRVEAVGSLDIIDKVTELATIVCLAWLAALALSSRRARRGAPRSRRRTRRARSPWGGACR